MFQELDSVVLARDLEEHHLERGDVGAIVHIHGEHEAFEVEFVTGAGRTVALATLRPEEIRLLGSSEILHARDVSQQAA